MDTHAGLHSQAILTINAGSSSIKFSLFLVPQLNQIIAGQIDGIGGEARIKVKLASKNTDETIILPNGSRPQNHREALSFLIDWLHQFAKDVDVIAVGHRVVHGGQNIVHPL
jgi:acetate kinase